MRVWALKLEEPWTCPCCGDVCHYGGRCSLWSLLPFVHHHLVIDMTVWAAKPGTTNYVEIEVDRALPPVEDGLKNRLRGRLTDEVKDYRRHWWGPLTREEREKRRQFRRELQELRRPLA